MTEDEIDDEIIRLRHEKVSVKRIARTIGKTVSYVRYHLNKKTSATLLESKLLTLYRRTTIGKIDAQHAAAPSDASSASSRHA
jgi:hypothetical protein